MATEIGMLERVFWDTYPIQLAEHVEMFKRREAREWERAAWMVHYIMAAWMGNKAPSVDRLRGRVTDA